MKACSIGLHNLVKKTLDNKPYFSYKENDNFGTITILDSYTKKINIKNSMGIAGTVATSINTAINNGYKNIGNVAFVGRDIYNRGIVNIKATDNQLNLINAIDNSKEADELQKEVDKEREIEEERALRESKKEEWEENREYFESDEPFTRASVDEKPIPDTGIQGTLFQEPGRSEKPTIKPGVEELFNSNPELANQVYEALGFKRKEYSTSKKRLQGSTELVDDVASLMKDKSFVDKYVGFRKYFNIVTDIETMIGTYGHYKEGLTQPESVLQELQNLIDSHIEGFNYNVTPQQKQQAFQAYFQYLDTVFPDSKVKDIVYHFTTEKGKEGILNDNKFKINKPLEEDISFTKNEQWKDDYRSEKISVLLNIKNPTTRNDRYGMQEQKLENSNIDGGDIKTSDTHRALVVFEPEQIHILGSKQDIEEFKKFVGESTQTVESYRAQEQAELSQRMPNIENYKVNGKVDKSLITDENDLEIYNEIYDKYDALITPLLEASEETKEQPEDILKTYEEDLEQNTEDIEDTEDTSNINEDDDFLEEDFPVEEKENKPNVEYTFNEEFELLNRKLISLGLNTLSLEDYDNFTNIQKEIIKSCYGI